MASCFLTSQRNNTSSSLSLPQHVWSLSWKVAPAMRGLHQRGWALTQIHHQGGTYYYHYHYCFIFLLYLYIYIYVYGGGLIFCLPVWLLERQKQHSLAILRQKEKSEGAKRTTKIGRAFFGSKNALFPQF